jgi:hypothetical protein
MKSFPCTREHGELKRVVNGVLLMLDSNIWRRFEDLEE